MISSFKGVSSLLISGGILLSGLSWAGSEASGGASRMYLSCGNQNHPSVSYKIEVMSGFFEVSGQKKWTIGTDIYRDVHFTNQEALIKSSAITSNESFTRIQGDGFSLIQSGPANFNMKSFPATLTLDETSGGVLTVNDLQCEVL